MKKAKSACGIDSMDHLQRTPWNTNQFII